MGYFRFRKTIGVLPGVRINLSKTGLSTSLGGHGATVNVGRGKRMITLGIPGTGLSYRTTASMGLLLLLAAVAVVGVVAWFLFPDVMRSLLHYWRPF